MQGSDDIQERIDWESERMSCPDCDVLTHLAAGELQKWILDGWIYLPEHDAVCAPCERHDHEDRG